MKNKIFIAFLILLSVSANARTFTDSADRNIEIDDEIERVVPSGPIAQMTLIAIAPEKLAGLSNKLSRQTKEFLSPSISALPVLGQLYGSSDLNIEELAVINPQLFIDIGEPKQKVFADMNRMENRLNIQTVHINASLKNTPKSFEMLGVLLNKPEQGKILSTYTQGIYNRTLEILNQVQKKRVLYINGNRASSTLAKGSYHGQVIDLLAENVAVIEHINPRGAGNDINPEQVMVWNPDIIIADTAAFKAIKANPIWQILPAVRQQKIYRVPDQPYNWITSPPAVNRYLGLIWLAKLLYPENTDYDLYEEVRKYYDLFYHTNLSREQFNRLTAN